MVWVTEGGWGRYWVQLLYCSLHPHPFESAIPHCTCILLHTQPLSLRIICSETLRDNPWCVQPSLRSFFSVADKQSRWDLHLFRALPLKRGGAASTSTRLTRSYLLDDAGPAPVIGAPALFRDLLTRCRPVLSSSFSSSHNVLVVLMRYCRTSSLPSPSLQSAGRFTSYSVHVLNTCSGVCSSRPHLQVGIVLFPIL